MTDFAFIDRIALSVHCPHKGLIGRYINQGTLIDTGEVVRQTISYKSVRGPHDFAQVKTAAPEFVKMVFCPGKYLQGHNLYIAGDIPSLVGRVVPDVLERLDLSLCPQELERLLAGDVGLQEVHCTAMLDLESQREVDRILTLLGSARHLRLRSHPEGRDYPGSQCFGTGTSYRLTFYDKRRELVRNQTWGCNLPEEAKQEIIAWSEGKLRVEVSLKRRKLASLGLERASDWGEEAPGRIVRQELAKLRVNERAPQHQEVEGLPPRHKQVYHACLGGCGLDHQFASTTTLSKYRREFWELGIDIDTIQEVKYETNHIEDAGIPFSEFINMPFVAFDSL